MEKGFSLIELFKLGGPFMWVLLAFSVATIAIVIERCIYLAWHNCKVAPIRNTVMNYLQQVKQVSFLRESVYGYHRSMGSASVRQVLDCVVHPLSNIRAKRFLYSRLKALYTAQGVYGAYRRRLWLYLFRVGLS